MTLTTPRKKAFPAPFPGTCYYDTDGLYKLEWLVDQWELRDRKSGRILSEGPAAYEIGKVLSLRPYRTEPHVWETEQDEPLIAAEREFYNSTSWLTPDAEEYLTSEEIDFSRRHADALSIPGAWSESIEAVTRRPLRNVPFIEL